MNRTRHERRARRVQPSGRPSGAPSRLDAAKLAWDPPHTREGTDFADQLQTPSHNLIPAKSGPKVGVHFNSSARERFRAALAPPL